VFENRLTQEERENGVMRSFVTCISTKYNYSDQVKEDGIGREYITHGRESEYIQDFDQIAPKKETKRINTDVGVGKILKYILEK
jgi:hypothetical protein